MHPKNFHGIDDFYFGILEDDGSVTPLKKLNAVQDIEVKLKPNYVMVVIYTLISILALMRKDVKEWMSGWKR